MQTFAITLVVICLKSLTFVVSITTEEVEGITKTCCDLLEKSYLCGINNNRVHRYNPVVGL